MSKPATVLQIGAGAHGFATYVNNLLPRLQAEGLIRCIGIVDPGPETLQRAVNAWSGDQPVPGYPDLATALAAEKPDMLILCSPYRVHEADCLLAAEQGIACFIEKPLSDSLESCCRIAHAFESRNLKAAVNLSAAFDREKRAFTRLLRNGMAGQPEFISARLAWDHRNAAKHRAGDPHPYIMEAGIHVMQMLINFSGSVPKRVYNLTWKSPGHVFEGNASNLLSIEMENGVRCALEGSWTAAANINSWRNEMIRSDSRTGSLLMERQEIHFCHNAPPPQKGLLREQLEITEPEPPAGGTEVLFREFLNWTAGNQDSHPTRVNHALESMALMFAAVQSAETGQAVDVQELLSQAHRTLQP